MNFEKLKVLSFKGLSEQHLPIRRIRNKKQAAKASAVVRAMAGQKMSIEQKEYFDLLVHCLGVWEREHCDPTPAVSPQAMYTALYDNHYGDDKNMTPLDYLAEITGCSREEGRAFLDGRGELLPAYARALGKRFRMTPAAFINLEIE